MSNSKEYINLIVSNNFIQYSEENFLYESHFENSDKLLLCVFKYF